jgi:hypothetical protein
MEPQQNFTNQAPASTPTQATKQSSGKIWMVLSILLTVVSIGLLVALVFTLTADSENTDTSGNNSDSTMEDEDQEGATDDMDDSQGQSAVTEWEAYEGAGIDFEFPDTWNLYTSDAVDTPSGDPELFMILNEEPIRISSPSEGYPVGEIIITQFTTGDAYLAPYEGDWAVYETDTITIGGQEVERLQLSASEDVVLGPQNMEVLFFFGEKYSYEVTYYYHDGEKKPEWERIKNSIRYDRNWSAR